MGEPYYQPTLVPPRARRTDPEPSHLAVETIRPGNAKLVEAIRRACWTLGPSTAYDIADEVEARFPGRWGSDTIRTACARAGLTKFEGGTTPRGNPCCLYGVCSEEAETRGRL